MKHVAVAVIVAAFALHAPLASADTSTAPGQQKKEAGAQSAKEYAPGQEQPHGKPKADAGQGKKAKKNPDERVGKGAKKPNDVQVGKGAKKPNVAAPGPSYGKKK